MSRRQRPRINQGDTAVTAAPRRAAAEGDEEVRKAMSAPALQADRPLDRFLSALRSVSLRRRRRHRTSIGEY